MFSWENGRDQVSARMFFRLAILTGSLTGLDTFFRGNSCPDVTTREGLSQFLQDLAGNRTLADVARHMKRDRHVLGRWVRGQTEIPLAELLEFVEVTTLRIYDFLALFVNPAQLKEAAEGFKILEAARNSARKLPWSHAIVHMVELPSYALLKKHESGWFASRLGLTIQEERNCLELLLTTGQLVLQKNRYRVSHTLNVDTRRDPDTSRLLASFWMKEGARRVLTPAKGGFAFNAFGISTKDLDTARELQSEYFQKLRALIAGSHPTQAVAVATFQLFSLFEEGQDNS